MPYPSLEARVESAVLCARRNGDGCAVIMLDVDRFAELNERLGQARADEVLSAVQVRLVRHVRANDAAIRVAGNTFAVILHGLHHWKDAARTARAIARGFELPFPIGHLDVRVSASIGVATFPYAAYDATELLQLALQKMLLVKQNGGYGILNAGPREETAARSDENAACATSFPDRRHLRIVANA